MFNVNKKIKILFITIIVLMCGVFFCNIDAATYTRDSGTQIGYTKGIPLDKTLKGDKLKDAISQSTGAVVYYNAQIDGNTAYCMDIIKKVPASGTSVSKSSEKLSPLQIGILIEGRKNDPLATQIALWQSVASDPLHTPVWYDTKYLKSGMSGVTESRFNNAVSSANTILNNARGYTSNSFSSSSNISLEFDKSQRNTVVKDGYVYRGPYYFNTNSRNPISYKVNRDSQYVILVQNVGATSAMTSIMSGQPVYIKAPANYSNGKVENFGIDFYTNTPVVYNGYIYSAGSSYQRFAIVTEEQQTIKKHVDFSWTVKGEIQIIKKSDADGSKLKGVEFTLYDSNKNIIKTSRTNSEGIVKFTNLEFGTYYIKETETVCGYKITNTNFVQIHVNSAETITKEFTNHLITGRVKLVKYVEYTGLLSSKQTVGKGDATFGIYDAYDEIEVATMSTDANGVATSPNLKVGKYYIKEKSVNTNYMKINPSVRKSFEITEDNDNQTLSLGEAVNEGLTGSLEIYKYAEDGGQIPIQGATFEIYKPNGGLLTTVKTNAGGKAYVKDLTDGNYTYKETSVPKGYVLDSSTKSFSITKTNRDVKVSVKNDIKHGKLVINKTREGVGTPISGVVFNVYASNKQTVVATLTTDANGRTGIDNLRYGTYYIKEVSAPANVIMNTKEEKIVIGDEAGAKLEYTINLTNDVIVDCAIRLKKVDTSGAPIQGVRFALYSDASGMNKIAETTTDVNGLALFNKLKEGTYYYKEVSTPDGYITTKIAELQPINVNQTNQIYTETIENTPIVGKVKIYKKDDENKVIAGAEFDIKNSDGAVVGHLVTDQNGVAISENLRKGNYSLVETKAPTGYVLKTEAIGFTINTHNEVVEKTIINDYNKGLLKIKKVDADTKQFIEGAVFEIYKINDNGTETLVDTIRKYDANGVGTSQELKNGKYYFKETVAPYGAIIDNNRYEFVITDEVKLIERTIENKIKKGQVALLKTGEDGSFIAGAKFELSDTAGNVLETLTTDENGSAISQKYKVGTYYIRESYAPETWVPITKVIEVDITEDNQVITLKDEIVNKKIRGGIKVTKKDDAGNPVAGVEFSIYKENGTFPVAKLVTDENGVAMVTELEIGKYYFVETKVPDNIYINSESVDFEIDRLGQLIEKEVVNERVKGKLVITKVNQENGTAIEGVVFEIYDSSEQLLGTIYTDVDGIATTESLQDKEGNPITLYAGTYYYSEVSAPDRFYFDTNVKSFTISKGNETNQVYIENIPFKLPQTGAAISTDGWIIIIVSIVSITGYVIGNIIINRKRFA